MKKLLFILGMTLFFGFPYTMQAQVQKKPAVKTQKQVKTKPKREIKTVTKKSQLKKVKPTIATAQNTIPQNVVSYNDLQLIDKKLASRFQRTENYPSHLNQPKNGNTVKAVYKNNHGVYRIQYNARDDKEYNYYTDESAMLSEYEIFELLRGFNDYQETQDLDLLQAFNEVGIKTLNGAELIKVELNSKAVRKATYQNAANQSIIVYADAQHTNWLKDGVYSTKLH